MTAASLNEIDPYDGLPVSAERPMTHGPDDVCRFVGPHPRAYCRYVHPPSAAHPTQAGELSTTPEALTRPEPPAPWEDDGYKPDSQHRMAF